MDGRDVNIKVLFGHPAIPSQDFIEDLPSYPNPLRELEAYRYIEVRPGAPRDQYVLADS